MVVSILNLDKCIEKFGKIKGIDYMPPIRRGTEKVYNSAKKFVPIYGGQNSKANQPYTKQGLALAGELWRSINFSTDDKTQTGTVFATAGHAIYQEFGTRYQKGTPFMRPALTKESPGIKSDMENYIKEQIAQKVA